MLDRARNFCIAVLVILLSLAAPNLLAQEDQTLLQNLEAGKRKFMNIDFPGCVEQMTQIIGELNSVQAEKALDQSQISILTSALEYRALAHFNMAAKSAAQADFTRLLEISPGYKLNESLATGLIQEFFTSIKQRTVGYLTLTTHPEGATVVTGRRELGLSNFTALPMKAGPHKLSIYLSGYAILEAEIFIEPDKTFQAEYTLDRITASINLRTSPTGVDVYLDGLMVGTTSGTAGTDYMDTLARLGLFAEDVSQEFKIPYVDKGAHTLQFKKNCFESKTYPVNVTETSDFSFPEPVILKVSFGSLELTNLPEEARVRLNGEEQNLGQASYDKICTGEYNVEVTFASGRFTDKVVVTEKNASKLEVQLNPTMVFLQPFLSDTLEEDEQAEVKTKINSFLSSIDDFEIITPDVSDYSLPREDLNLLRNQIKEVAAGSNSGKVPLNFHRVIRQICRKFNSNIIMAAVQQQQRIGSHFKILIFGPEIPYFESLDLDLENSQDVEKKLGVLNQRINFSKSWLGITAVDTKIHHGTVVIAVHPGSPADQAGVKPGDVITSIDNQAIEGYRQVLGILEQKSPGDSVELVVSNDSQSRTLHVTFGESPLLLPLNNPAYLYKAAIASMLLVSEMNRGTDLEQLALFNIGIAMAHFGAWEDSIRYLRRVNIGEGPGVNQGTVEYYLGLGFEALGFSNEALLHYRQAMKYPNATIDSNDGPPLMPLVSHKVKVLESGS